MLRALARELPCVLRPKKRVSAYGPKGKPALAARERPLRFNVSNSGDLAAYAFTFDCEIGVDVEHRRRLLEIESIAQRFFAPDEVAELMDLPESERPDGFFNCWTRKEAYIKAVGDGLSVPLDSFRVTLQPGVPARMVDSRWKHRGRGTLDLARIHSSAGLCRRDRLSRPAARNHRAPAHYRGRFARAPALAAVFFRSDAEQAEGGLNFRLHVFLAQLPLIQCFPMIEGSR